jgi:hypothetical protein
MRNLIERCNVIKKNVAKAITMHPDSVALGLGSLLLTPMDDHTLDKTELITHTLVSVSEIIGKAGVERLWEAMDFPKVRWYLMEDRTRESIDSLRFWILSTPDYFKKIEPNAIIKQCANPQYFRLALIALLRMNSVDDPFISFNFKLLKLTAPELQMARLQSMISQCPLPSIEHLQTLGTKPELAKCILLDLASHPRIFEVDTAFAHRHPSLRTEIAQKWRSYFHEFPLLQAQIQYLQTVLPALKLYPEFNDITIGERRPRVFKRDFASHSRLYSFATYIKQFTLQVFEQADLAVSDTLELTKNLNKGKYAPTRLK